jgi:hypothetical protein
MPQSRAGVFHLSGLARTLATFLGYWFMMELEIGLTVATCRSWCAVGIGVNDAFIVCNRLQSPPVQGAKIADAFKARARASRP